MISHAPIHHLSKKERIWKQSLWYAFLSSTLLLVIIIAHYNLYISSQTSQRNSQEVLNLELGKTIIITELSNIQSDVNFLARQAELRGYFDQLDDTTLDLMAREFKLFSDEKIIYDQIRLIDTAGHEVIRINNQNGESVILQKDQLQEKSNRYYFQETMQLERNEIYISPFDLNVEHGKIQIPLKPVIRFGTPVFDSSGNKVGVLILNYLGNRLLNNFRTATANISDHVMLINSDGFWLSHTNRDLEWGFMLDKEHTFASDFPAEWENINSYQEGQFLTRNGLFSFSTVYPGLEITGLRSDFDDSQTQAEYYNHPWYLVAHISPAEITMLQRNFIQNNLLFYLIIYMIFLLGSHFIARLKTRHQMAEIEVEFEQHFRKVLESIELNVLAIDLEGNITFCNDALLYLLGWKRDQLIGKNWIDTLVVNRYKSDCELLFKQTLSQDHKPSTHESWLQDRAGKEYLIRWHDTYMTDSTEKMVGLIFMGENITQHRENEIKVRHLSQAVEQSPASVMLTNNKGLIEYINPKFERLTGYTLDEIKGLNPRILKSGETSADDYSSLWEKISQGGTWRGTFHNRKKNGELYWESASISGIRNPEGEITHFLAVKEDITEHKMLEERFKHCFNSAPVAMIMTDKDDNILLANDHLQRLYGYSEDELVGQDVNKIVPDELTQNEMASEFSASDSQLQLVIKDTDILTRKKTGEIFPVEIGASSAPSIEGQLNITAIIDLSSRKKLENELLQRNDEISRNQALNTVGKMANMIAHDLRNPLSSIKMGLQIFQKQSNNFTHQDVNELNQIALDQVHYMEEILHDLMSYSRPDALKLEWIDIKKVLEHSINLVEKESESSNAKINTWFEKGLPIINADSRKLSQVFSNLLTNALQSVETLEGINPVINITVRLDLGDENSYIKVMIQDNGCGIDPETVHQLFEPFYTSRSKGTGLGLAIAKRFVELQNGELDLQSDSDEGCTAIVKLNIDPTS